jgi:mono/diheme cytochrome c family protein
MLCAVLRHQWGEQQVIIGQGEARPTLRVLATLIVILGATGCARDEEPAQPAAQPPPAAAARPAAAAPPAAAAIAIRDGADPLTHGRYLVETIAGCGNCHTPHLPDGSLDESLAFAGAFVIEEPVFKAYARNITPDMETGIGSWSEAEIVKAVREGIRPDGKVLGPPMSFGWYRDISDTDARAIAVYLKSLRPIRNVVPESTFQIPLPGYGPPLTSVPDVPKTDIVKYGEYLAGPIGHCMDCHTTYVMGAIDMAQLGRGGNVYARPFIYDWAAVSANITSHPTAGLGAWTDAEIKRAITEGISRDGRTLLPFMPYGLYKKMEPSDLDAVVAYLRSLPPLGPAAAPAAE